LEELKALIGLIFADSAKKTKKETSIVLLGDLIDRGQDSRGVIEYWKSFTHPTVKTYHLLGNHEEMFVRVMKGETHLLKSWVKYGGYQCLHSYGLDPDKLLLQDPDIALIAMKKHIPSSHIKFLETGYDKLEFGNYCLVHAGVDPAVPIAEQTTQALRWMREPFLSWKKPLDMKIIHGHTITKGIEIKSHRIGVDTGAYKSKVLSCVCIEDEKLSTLSTDQA